MNSTPADRRETATFKKKSLVMNDNINDTPNFSNKEPDENPNLFSIGKVEAALELEKQ